MRILIKYPTKIRNEKFFSTLDKYYSLANDIENMFFVISLDSNDGTMNNPETLKKLDGYKNLKYFVGDSKSKIDAVNRDVEKYDDWDIVVVASDDMIPQVKGYDDIIREKMKQHFPDTDGVLWFSDGFQKNKLNTLCILGKKYYQRFGYIYHPDYKSCYSDDEFTQVANMLGKQIYFEDVIIRHEHPIWGFGHNDAIYHDNSKNLKYDFKVFNERRAQNFFLNQNINL